MSARRSAASHSPVSNGTRQLRPLFGWKASTLLSAILGLVTFRWWHMNRSRKHDGDSLEPEIFKQHSQFHSFTTASGYVYSRIRVLYHAHPKAAKLPNDIPLLVFIHGLGGNATQFGPLLSSLVNVAPCLAVDLPGCGASEFTPNVPYTTSALAELICNVIEKYRDSQSNQQVVLVGHSMGCSIAALLASSSSPLQHRLHVNWVIGFIAICPRARSFSAQEAKSVGRLKWVPELLFDLFRLWDRRGGLNSQSITRMVGDGADEHSKKLQQRFNSQSRTPVFLRFVAGMLPAAEGESQGLPGEEIWSGIKVPLFVIGAESDKVTRPEEVELIEKWLSKPRDIPNDPSAAKPLTQQDRHDAPGEQARDESLPAATEADTQLPTAAGDVQLAQNQLITPSRPSIADPIISTPDLLKDTHSHTIHSFALKITIFPSPASHGLMYTTSTVRILAGLIETFLSHHVDERLTLAWQLQQTAKQSGKWDLKNQAKWRSVDPCSEPIAGVFRAMKTMNETDTETGHNPREFVKKFGAAVKEDGVAIVVDISHERPVYEPKGLEDAGIEYHKFPTVSKLPPTTDEVEHFIALIDELRKSPKVQPKEGQTVHPTIGVHCHYGFNRTGYFLVCYLIERLGYTVQGALEEFARKRPPGIKHEHFVNELYVRYAVHIDRRGTIVM